jgi:hypothetical protein
LVGGWGRRQVQGRGPEEQGAGSARGGAGRERRGRLGARAAAPRGGDGGGRLGAWAAARGGGGGGGDGGVRVFSACGRLKMRHQREGKTSAVGFKAQVYSSVNRRINLGHATWALPCIFIGY